MTTVEVPCQVVQKKLWPGENYRVRIKAARVSGDEVVFEVEGLDEGSYRPYVQRTEQTTFRPCKS